MCTAISYLSNDHYFGRNLDLEHAYIEQVTITPRNFPFHFRMTAAQKTHYAIIGMAAIVDNFPLYYDATNEFGLSIAGLNFPGNAAYMSPRESFTNVAPYELIPWILGQCKTIAQVRTLLDRVNLIDIPFNELLPLSPLHFMICDRNESIVVEPLAEGIVIHDNPVGVLTNNPPFDYHMHNLSNYCNLTSGEAENRFTDKIPITLWSRGMGAIGLPGDLSSASRFIRASFTKLNSVSDGTFDQDVSQFFHILESVSQQRGCVKVGNKYEQTIYTSCCNTDMGIYCYTIYDNRQISAVSLHNADLESSRLVSYPLITQQQLHFQN